MRAPDVSTAYRHDVAQGEAQALLAAASATGRLSFGPTYSRGMAEAFGDLARASAHNARAPHEANAASMSYYAARLAGYVADVGPVYECDVAEAAKDIRERWGINR